MKFPFFILLLIALVLSACRTDNEEETANHRQPNIILIFVDDLGFGDLGSYGAENIDTKVLDKMAEKGLRLTEFYSASPVCTPARAALMTSRYPVRYGVNLVFFPETFLGLPQTEITIAELLRDVGYSTAIIGKWHLGHHDSFLPTEHGFDYFFGMPYSNDMRYSALMRNKTILNPHPDQSKLTQSYTTEAIEFIEKQKDEPFFLYLAHTMPHVPLYASSDFAGKSAGGLYGDVVEEIDWSVGKIVDTLESNGLSENTLIVFTSDNGPSLQMEKYGGSAGGLRGGKTTTFEGGMRVPAIFYWPSKIPPQVAKSGVMSTLDIGPTLADIADVEPPKDWKPDGKSQYDAILGRTSFEANREFFYYFRGQLEAVRKGDWKLKLAHKGQHPEYLDLGWPGGVPPHGPLLFNLRNDPYETNNLATLHPDKTAELMQVIQRFEEEIGETPPSIVHRGGQDYSAQNYRDRRLDELRKEKN